MLVTIFIIHRGDHHLRSSNRKLFLKFEVLTKDVPQGVIVRKESYVGYRELATDEVFLLAKDGLQHSKNAAGLISVAFNGGRDFLRVIVSEPSRLTEIRSDGKYAQ